MKCFSINPGLVEALKSGLLASDWLLTAQDAGQTHLVGWGYYMTWQKDNEQVTLRFTDQQGQSEALIELTDGAEYEINMLLDAL